MLINDQNLNSIDKKILDSYREKRFPLRSCTETEILEHLCSALNNVNEVVDKYLNTLLHKAALYQRADMVLYLLKRGANPQLQNAPRNTPLHIAAVVDKEGFIMELLLKSQVNLHLQNVDGNTPLHLAIFYKNFQAIEQFFSYKSGTEVFINVINNYGKTPLDLAKENGYKDVLNFINEKREDIAHHMVTYSFGLDNCKHFVNNVGIDINNMLLASGDSILAGLINYFNRPGICQQTLNRKLISIKHSIECGARIFKVDGNGKSMMSILVDITDDQRRRSICNTLEKYKDSLCFEKEKSCIEEMPNGSTKEQMRQLLQKWQSGVKLYECLKDTVANMPALNLVIGERRNTDERQFEEPLTTQSILRGWLQKKNRQHNNTHMDNLNISRPAASRARDAG